MIRLLVTGANGFVGSHIVEAALNMGWEVWGSVRGFQLKVVFLFQTTPPL